MSDKIIKALSEGFVLRMRWWARFRADGGVAVATSWPVDGPGHGIGAPTTRFHTTRIPPMLGIVHDTEAAVDVLPARYAQTVKQFWLFEGRSLRWHGRHRQIDYHTFEIWLLKGHELLKAEFAATSDRWHRQVEEARAQLTPEQWAIVIRNEEAEAAPYEP